MLSASLSNSLFDSSKSNVLVIGSSSTSGRFFKISLWRSYIQKLLKCLHHVHIAFHHCNSSYFAIHKILYCLSLDAGAKELFHSEPIHKTKQSISNFSTIWLVHNTRIKEGILWMNEKKSMNIRNDVNGTNTCSIKGNNGSHVLHHVNKHVTLSIFSTKDSH